jgi:hypothetical protein
MTPLDVERTRREALAALGPHGDPRARQALERACIEVELDVATWEATAGTVRGHRVTLGVDAAILAEARRAPAVRDALHAAVASSVARQRGEALVDLRMRWDGRSDARAVAGHPYRGGAPVPVAPVTPAEGLAAFLEAAGHALLAAAAGRSAITVTRTREPARVAVTVRSAAGDAEALAAGRAAVEEALTALLREGDELVVVTVAAR